MCHPSYKTFQFLGNICREMIHLPFPFVFSSLAFGVKFFWIIVITLIEVINGQVLFLLNPLTQLNKLIWRSQPQDCLEDVLKLLLKFLLGFEEGVLLCFTHWCFGNVGRGAHVEVVKRAYMIILGSGLQKECKIQILRCIFRPRFDACISGNIQPIDLKLKTLVDLDFNDP